MRLAEFKQARERTGEIEMRVTGRTSGREIAIPVWFVEQGAKVSLLPVSVHFARKVWLARSLGDSGIAELVTCVEQSLLECEFQRKRRRGIA